MRTIERRLSALPGKVGGHVARFARLNFFREEIGYANVRPNILLVNESARGWFKLREGEVVDFGQPREINLAFDYFAKAFNGTTRRPDFELEFSDSPLTDLRTVQPNYFWDGASVTVNNNSNTNSLNVPPTAIAVADKYSQSANAVQRRFRLNNQSGGSLLLRRDTVFFCTVQNGSVFDQPISANLTVRNQSGGALAFDYQFIGEWI